MIRLTHLLDAAFLVVLLGTLGCGDVEADETLPQPLDLNPGELIRSDRCGQCHKDIHSVWRGSIHARAASNAVFLEAFDEAVHEHGDSARELCLKCHAPNSVVTGDLEISSLSNQEGVSCDFCHSLVVTRPSDMENLFTVQVGGAKLGPVEDAASKGHPVSYSQLHKESEFCSGCHEYENAMGVPILTTYSEWQDFNDSGGSESCQECHMPLVLGSVADPRVERSRSSFVNLHRMPGGHSRAQLAKSLRLRILEVERDGDFVRSRIVVRNSGAGHSVPTGSPLRKVLLTVVASTPSGFRMQQEHLFQKVVVDRNGSPILKDSRTFLDAARIQSDTRLSAGEERFIDAAFAVPPNENVAIEATLTYLYSAHNRPETEIRLEFFSDRKNLTVHWSRYEEPGE